MPSRDTLVQSSSLICTLQHGVEFKCYSAWGEAIFFSDRSIDPSISFNRPAALASTARAVIFWSPPSTPLTALDSNLTVPPPPRRQPHLTMDSSSTAWERIASKRLSRSYKTKHRWDLTRSPLVSLKQDGNHWLCLWSIL